MFKLLKFWAPWCGPCRNMAPVVDKLVEELPELQLVSVNIDDNPQDRVDFSVRTIPTFILLDKDGNEVSRKVGSAPLSALKEWVDGARAV